LGGEGLVPVCEKQALAAGKRGFRDRQSTTGRELAYSPNSMSSTQEIIYDIIAKTCSIDRSKITMESTLKDLDVHSLDAVQVLFEIEDRFDVSVPDREDQYAVGTVRDLVEGVDQLLAAKTTAA
jgi:acyl carrier protein